MYMMCRYHILYTLETFSKHISSDDVRGGRGWWLGQVKTEALMKLVRRNVIYAAEY